MFISLSPAMSCNFPKYDAKHHNSLTQSHSRLFGYSINQSHARNLRSRIPFIRQLPLLCLRKSDRNHSVPDSATPLSLRKFLAAHGPQLLLA